MGGIDMRWGSAGPGCNPTDASNKKRGRGVCTYVNDGWYKNNTIKEKYI